MATAGRSAALAVPAPARAALAWAQRALGVASLAGLVVCSYVVVTAAAYRPSPNVPMRSGGFPGWLRGPLSDLGGYITLEGFAVYVIVMTACFLVAVLCAPLLHPGWTIATVVLLHLLYFLGPPLISGDVAGYIDWSRMGALHGLNPYAHDSGSVVSDPIYRFVQWDDFSSPYGPLFTLGTYALVPLGVAGELWAIKVAVLAASLGCCVLVWLGARTLGRDPVPGLALYGLNPAVLLYAVGGVHNDVLMMLPLLAGIWLVLLGRERVGAGVAALAVGIKASAGLAMPFLMLGARSRRDALVGAIVAAVTIVAIGLVAFGPEVLDFINVLGTQQGLNSGTSVIAQLGAVFGWHGNPVGARVVATIVFSVVLVWLLVRTWVAREGWLENAGWATVALMACTSWLLAWYIVWLVPLAALARSAWLRAAAVGMTVFVVLTRMVPFLD